MASEGGRKSTFNMKNMIYMSSRCMPDTLHTQLGVASEGGRKRHCNNSIAVIFSVAKNIVIHYLGRKISHTIDGLTPSH